MGLYQPFRMLRASSSAMLTANRIGLINAVSRPCGTGTQISSLDSTKKEEGGISSFLPSTVMTGFMPAAERSWTADAAVAVR